MKALMTNSTQPDIFTAKMRDDTYLRHLRQVQKINNRQNANMQAQLKQHNYLYQSHQKSRKQAKQFDTNQQNSLIGKKNEQMMLKIKSIRSMFNFNSLKKTAEKDQIEQSLNNNTTNITKESQKDRYQRQNQETKEVTQISQHIQQTIAQGYSTRLSKQEAPKTSRLSLHYYLRKRQQEMIELQNEKLKKGILSQKSVYSSPKKLNKSLNLPSVKPARQNFDQRTALIQKKNSKEQPNSQTKYHPQTESAQVKL